jgi:hypothetical protein
VEVDGVVAGEFEAQLVVGEADLGDERVGR